MKTTYSDAVESCIVEIKALLREDATFSRYREETDDWFLDKVAILREYGVDEEYIEQMGDSFDKGSSRLEVAIIAIAKGIVQNGYLPKEMRKDAGLNKSASRYLSEMYNAGFFTDDEVTR